MVGEVQTLDTSELGLDYRLSRKHKIHNVWKKKKELKFSFVCFILILLNLVPDYFHYCITVAIVLWISLSPLINIIVIVYYADLSCDMQDQELLSSHWSVFLAPSSDWLIWVSLPLARDAISSQPWPHSSWDISGLWMLWFSRNNSTQNKIKAKNLPKTQDRPSRDLRQT